MGIKRWNQQKGEETVEHRRSSRGKHQQLRERTAGKEGGKEWGGAGDELGGEKGKAAGKTSQIASLKEDWVEWGKNDKRKGKNCGRKSPHKFLMRKRKRTRKEGKPKGYEVGNGQKRRTSSEKVRLLTGPEVGRGGKRRVRSTKMEGGGTFLGQKTRCESCQRARSEWLEGGRLNISFAKKPIRKGRDKRTPRKKWAGGEL